MIFLCIKIIFACFYRIFYGIDSSSSSWTSRSLPDLVYLFLFYNLGDLILLGLYKNQYPRVWIPKRRQQLVLFPWIKDYLLGHLKIMSFSPYKKSSTSLFWNLKWKSNGCSYQEDVHEQKYILTKYISRSDLLHSRSATLRTCWALL